MRPSRLDIAVPPFPPGIEWLGGGVAAAERVVARGPLLVHFFDFAQLNSVRTLPYLRAWDERYREHGLTTVGVHSPRFPFTAEREAIRDAALRLGIPYPVAADSGYAIWHDYGCKGWPSLFLWGQGGALRWVHYGEGEYRETEEAIQELIPETRPEANLPDPLAPLRPSDAPGARVVPPSEEIFPGGSESSPWTAGLGGDSLELDYAAGGAYASVDGAGSLDLRLDGGEVKRIEISAPGLFELAVHERHERHHLALGVAEGLRVWSLSFAPGVP